MKLPLWRLATFLLLSVALALAVANGRTVEAVIIGALLAPTLFALGVWIYLWSTGYWTHMARKYATEMPQEDTYLALRSEIEAELGPQLALSDIDLDAEDLRGIADAVATEILLSFDVTPKPLDRGNPTPNGGTERGGV